MALQDYFDVGNLGPYNEFTGIVTDLYRELHDENYAKTQEIIEDLDARVAVLEDPLTQVITQIGQAASSAAITNRVSVNDFFSVSRVYDAKINGASNTLDKVYLKSLSSGMVTGDFLCSRWPGWMINKTLINSTKDTHEVGVPIIFGAANLPGAGLGVQAGAYTGEALFYQRLDIHNPIEHLRGNTYTLVVEYTTPDADLFELVVRYGPTGSPTTIVGNGNSDTVDIDELLQTKLEFTVPDDADFVAVGLRFTGNAGDLYLTSIRVEPGGEDSATALGAGLQRKLHDELELVNAYYMRRTAIRSYGEPASLSDGKANNKDLYITASLGTSIPLPNTSQAQIDSSVEITAVTGYRIQAASVEPGFTFGDMEAFTAGAIDFTASTPFNALEQDRSPQHYSGLYTFIDSLIQMIVVQSNSATVLSNTPETFFAAEVTTVHPPEL